MVVTDHLGNKYSSKTEMCKKYGIGLDTYNWRIASGWSLKDALTRPIDIKRSTKQTVPRETIKDHLGNTYVTVRDMCKAYGVPVEVYYWRKRAGYSLDSALTGMKIRDHLGNKFRNEVEMCKKYDIALTTYRKRIGSGWSLKDALTKPVDTDRCGKPVTDHLGNNYKSISEMCRAYSIPVYCYKLRIDLGWSLKDALTKPNQITNRKQ